MEPDCEHDQLDQCMEDGREEFGFMKSQQDGESINPALFSKSKLFSSYSEWWDKSYNAH